MSANVTRVAKYILENPNLDRKAYNLYAQRALRVKMNNARVYVTNAMKRIDEFGKNAVLDVQRGRPSKKVA